ncbi:hypothetical protein G6F68_018937 [Rhizopus microsporus]|nr:hypothetical protein G6F68_018937 [Rhizopus microsporus]
MLKNSFLHPPVCQPTENHQACGRMWGFPQQMFPSQQDMYDESYHQGIVNQRVGQHYYYLLHQAQQQHQQQQRQHGNPIQPVKDMMYKATTSTLKWCKFLSVLSVAVVISIMKGPEDLAHNLPISR